MKNSILASIHQRSYLMLLLVLLLSTFTSNAQTLTQEEVCVESLPHTLNLNYNHGISSISNKNYSWYKVESNGSLTLLGQGSSMQSYAVPQLAYGVEVKYRVVYKFRENYIFSGSNKTVSKDFILRRAVGILNAFYNITNCQTLNLVLSAEVANSNPEFQWGLGSVVGENQVLTTTNQVINLSSLGDLGNHSDVWVRIVGCGSLSSRSKVITVKPHNLRVEEFLCNSNSLKLAVNGPNTTSYTWGYLHNGSEVILAGNTSTITINTLNLPEVGATDKIRFFVRYLCSPNLYIQVYPTSNYYFNNITASDINTCLGRYLLTANGNFPPGTIFRWSTAGGIFGIGAESAVLTTSPNFYASTGLFSNFVWKCTVVLPQGYCNMTPNTQQITLEANGNWPSNQNMKFITGSTSTLCGSSVLTSLNYSLSNGYNMVRWESSIDPYFESEVVTHSTTSLNLSLTNLAPTLSYPRYFRAVIWNDDCGEMNSPSYFVTNVATGNISEYEDGIWSQPLDVERAAVVKENFTMTSDLKVCSMHITEGVTFTIPAGRTLTIQNGLRIDAGANFHIAEKGSLIQVNNATNLISGNFSQSIVTSPITKFDYTYWSSPVQGFTLHTLSPNTLQDKYHSFDPSTASGWVNHNGGNHVMQPGIGYIVRAPQSFSTSTPINYATTFRGTPNNGTYNVTIKRGLAANKGNNLVGNPYPSSLSIEKFLTANSSAIEGYIELWSHSTTISSQTPGNYYMNYSQADYVKYNLTGNTFSSLNYTMPNNIDAEVATGQSFMVTFKNHASAVIPATATISFTNAMRASNHNTMFFRYANQTESESTDSSDSNEAIEDAQKDRLWLHIAKSANQFKQTLVGYVRGATDQKDDLFDAATTDFSNSVNLYSILDNQALTIQGRSWPFNAEDFVPLGYKVSTAGEFKIGLGMYDGVFADGQEVYLVDRLLGVYHDLKASDYEFISEAGQFDLRFQIRYTNATLSNPDFESRNLIAFAKNQIVQLQAPQTVESVSIYDLTGRQLYHNNQVNATDFQTPPLAIAKQVILLTVRLQDGSEVTQKIPFN